MLDEVIDELAALNADQITQRLARLRRELPGDIRLPHESQRTRARTDVRDEVRRVPYRAFRASSGESIWVGRGARDNDELTVGHSRPHDLWLHVKGYAGAHVVLRRESGVSTPDAVIDAAMLAAYFSERRDELVVDVMYTDKRYVQKRKGSAPGKVELLRESVTAVRIEPERLAQLLDSEGR
ncbi:MAG: NFACT RNA binding domain-containing protein [Polyangiaceae bacterium]